MAVTLVSRPTTPNVTGTKLLFEVSGSDISHPQYSYVMDIYLSGSSERIDRQFQQPNPDGVAQFNPADVLKGQLDYDNYWHITSSQYPENTVKTFDFRFGEAYGTSTSSSITIYTGSSNNYLQVFPGVLNPNNVYDPNDIKTFYTNGYNFDTGSFDFINFPAPKMRNELLSNQPSFVYDLKWIEDFGFFTKADYATATLFQDVYNDYMEVVGYLYAGNTGVAVSSSKFYPDPVNNPEFPNQRFTTHPVGPQNLMQYNDGWRQLIESGSVNFVRFIPSVETSHAYGQYFIRDNVYNSYISTNDDVDDAFDSRPVPPDEDKALLPLNTEYLQFAFINDFGFYDYYNCYSPLKRNSTADKNIVSLPKVDYSSAISTYNIENGGDKGYHVDTSDSYTISTGWIGETQAKWLEEFLESPEVFVRQGDEYVPIVVTNSEYQHNNLEARNKLFEYTITFRPSKGREIVQESYQDRTADLTSWQSKFNSSLELFGAFPGLQRPDAEVGEYSPYWRGSAGEAVSYATDPYGQPGFRQTSPRDFLYTSASIPFETALLVSGSETGTTASFDLEVYGDDNIIYTTSSVFVVGPGASPFFDFYTYNVPPYTASFSGDYYESIVWSGSLGLYTWPITSGLYRLNPYWVGGSSLNNSYNLTLTDSFYNSSSVANIERPTPISDEASVESHGVPYATLQLEPNFTIPSNIPVEGTLQITGSGTLVSGSITQSINNTTTGSWVVQGVDETTHLNMAVNESLPSLYSNNLEFWYNSKDPGNDPYNNWKDSLNNGPNLRVITGAQFLTGSSLPILTGSVYDTTNESGNAFFGENSLPELNGSGNEIATFQAWFRIESGSLNNGIFWYGGTSINTNKVDFIGVGTRASGSQAVLSIHGEYRGNPDIEETFPDLVVEPDTWYQVTLTRNGNQFNEHKLYLDNSSAYSPTNTALIEMGTYYISGTGFALSGDFKHDLGGYLSQFIYYKGREINTTNIQTNYDALKVWLETEL